MVRTDLLIWTKIIESRFMANPWRDRFFPGLDGKNAEIGKTVRLHPCYHMADVVSFMPVMSKDWICICSKLVMHAWSVR